jgi:site-specific recombinase XerD
MLDVTTEKAKAYIEACMAQTVKFQNHGYMRQQTDTRLSPYTIDQRIRSLKTFGKWLEKNEYPNPFISLPTPKKDKHLIDILTEDEISKLFQVYSPNSIFGARWHAVLSFCLDAFVRVSEVTGLKLSSLDLDAKRAKVLGKGNKERFVRFGDRTQRALSRYINLFRQGTSDQVFMDLEGNPLTLSGMHSIIKHARRRAGIKRVHFHLLRHTGATYFILNGGDAFELQELLGHDDISTTRIYVHLAKRMGAMVSARPSPLDALNVAMTPVSRRGRPRKEAPPSP